MPSATITYVETYNLIHCCYKECGVGFAIEDGFQTQRRKDHAWFYCPNGHQQHYSQDNEEEKLRKRLERRDRELTQEMQRVIDERKAHAVTKGKLTKTRNRAEKAMCPVDGCHRHFVQLARHISTQHPGYVS